LLYNLSMKTIKYISLILLVIVTSIIILGIYKFNYLANQEGYDVDGNVNDDVLLVENLDVNNVDVLEREPSQYTCVGEFCDGSGDGDNVERTVLQIPLIKDGGTIGCGADIFFAPHAIAKTLSPLHESYKLLFDIKAQPEILSDGFRNVVGSYTQLFYNQVTLTDGVAKVYLTGTLYGPGHCSLPELREQISKTALYFDSVNTVVIYLNNNIYDWCEQDESGGEGSCPGEPDYWIDFK